MQSKATDVSVYLDEAPPKWQPALRRMRSLCVEILTGYEEYMQYGMPCYGRNGTMEVSFAGQKQYLSLYIMKKDLVDEFKPALAGCKIGKGCIRFTRAESIAFEVVRRLLARNAESTGVPC